jgi:hypothetical protein
MSFLGVAQRVETYFGDLRQEEVPAAALVESPHPCLTVLLDI